MSILHKVKEAIRQPYVWPGAYPVFAVTTDGGALCCTCLSVEFKNICYSINEEINDGFRVADVVINYESEILCDNCGNDIEKAYEND